ncbi:MAG TPA: hypothetical protein VM070_00305, partial [Candidatus Saccharimonadales bacterium]|nr:hypothetical protein [Candidatus Saccharimonadales bacterium]
MADRKSLGARALRAIDEHRSDLIALSQAIHADPEIGYHEQRAAERLATMLAARGFTVTRPYRGVGTAYRADAAGAEGGPT